VLLSKIKKIPKNTNGRLAIPALAGLLVDTWDRIPQGIIDEASGKHGCMHV